METCTLSSCSKEGKDFRVCGRCRFAYYCSTECQKEDWISHKPTCFQDHFILYPTLVAFEKETQLPNRIPFVLMVCEKGKYVTRQVQFPFLLDQLVQVKPVPGSNYLAVSTKSSYEADHYLWMYDYRKGTWRKGRIRLLGTSFEVISHSEDQGKLYLFVGYSGGTKLVCEVDYVSQNVRVLLEAREISGMMGSQVFSTGYQPGSVEVLLEVTRENLGETESLTRLKLGRVENGEVKVRSVSFPRNHENIIRVEVVKGGVMLKIRDNRSSPLRDQFSFLDLEEGKCSGVSWGTTMITNRLRFGTSGRKGNNYDFVLERKNEVGEWRKLQELSWVWVTNEYEDKLLLLRVEQDRENIQVWMPSGAEGLYKLRHKVSNEYLYDFIPHEKTQVETRRKQLGRVLNLPEVLLTEVVGFCGVL